MVLYDDRFKARQCRAGGLYLSDDVDTVAILINHFAYCANLTLNACQSGVYYTLGFASQHKAPKGCTYPKGVFWQAEYTRRGYRVK